MTVICIIGLGLLCPIPFVVAFIVVPRRRSKRLMRVGVKVPGVCVRISWDENSSISTIEYSAVGGRKFLHTTGPNYSMPIDPGDVVDIVYDPDKPHVAQLEKWLDGEPGHRFVKRVVLAIEGIFLIPQLLWVYVIFYNLM